MSTEIETQDIIFRKQVEEALKNKDLGRRGVAISATINDPSESFLGDFLARPNQDIKEHSDESTKSNPFKEEHVLTKIPATEEEKKLSKKETFCKVLTLDKKEDLDTFNLILNAQHDPKSLIDIKIMEKQYNNELKTWQIFLIYDKLTPLTIK